MIFSNRTIEDIRKKSGLSFDRVSDFSTLAVLIREETKSTIGVTTLKRLCGYIDDPRETTKGTLNIVAQYLGFPSWDEYEATIRIDSDWNSDNDTVWIVELPLGTNIGVEYHNRSIVFEVVDSDEGKALKIVSAKNSSLMPGDVAYIDRLRLGEIIEARKVCRGANIGSYKTNGEIKRIRVDGHNLERS